MTGSVTVIVPAYNAEDVLGPCLQSLLDQRDPPPDYAVIVVDDASTDATISVAEAHCDRFADAGIGYEILRQQQRGGPAKARNRGAAAAESELLIFTDADCELTPEWLREMLAPFADPTVAAVKGAYLTRQTELGARFTQAELDERYRMLERAETVDVVFSYSAGFRREVFAGLGGFDASFPVADNEDTDLSWRLVAAGHKAVFNPKAQLYHRHAASVWDYLRKKASRGYWRMVVYRRFPKKAVKDSYTPQSLKLQILLAYLALALLILGIFWPGLFLLAGLVGVVFILTTLPFARAQWGRDRTLAILSPALLFGRALALGAGVLKALPTFFVRRRVDDPAE